MTSENLFPDVFYYLSCSLAPQRRSQLSRVLDVNGATPVDLADGRLTHYVSNSLPSSGSLETLPPSSTAYLVTPLWVERTLILATPQDPLCYSPDPAMLFSGVVATSCDLSASDNEVLSAGITSLGGQWRTALTKDVTHVFSLASGSPKYETAMHFRDGTGMKVVVPHWFDDVVRLGVRGLDTAEYEWPAPKLFKTFGVDALQGEEGRVTRKTKPLSEEKRALYETGLGDPAAGDLPARASPAESRNVWKDRKLVLGSSLGLNASQREAHKADVEREGGTVLEFDSPEEELERIAEADVYVTRYRSGPTFVKAYRLNKTIGTLPWLWYVRATGSLTRPADQLLHYPVPKKPIENFARHIITVTNYTGKDREYIKKLITTMGAEFTASMSGKNTIVIAAYLSGTKTTKALSWRLPVVNHLWLEDCFSQWRDLDPASSERYVVFPPAVDFGSVIGEERGLGSVGMGKGYDQWELEKMEREAEEEQLLQSQLQDSQSRSQSQPRKGILKNHASVRSIKSAEEVENVVNEGVYEQEQEQDRDVFMGGAGDASMGGYQDIDVPLNEDGRLSMDEGEDGMDVDSSRVEEMPVTPVKRGRGRPRKGSTSGTPAKKVGTPASGRRSSSRGKGKAQESGGEDKEEIPLKPKKLVRRAGRPSTSSKENLSDVEASRHNESDVEQLLSSAKKGSVIKTYRARSRSQSRTRGATPAKGRKGKAGVLSLQSSDEDSDGADGRAGEVASKRAAGSTAHVKRRPAVPTDTEAEASEAERGRRRGRPRKSVRRAGKDDGDEEKEEVPHRPRREVSVVLPTLKQVRSASRSRSRVRDKSDAEEKNDEEARDDEAEETDKKEKVATKTESATLQAQDAPSANVPKKRGRPRKKPLDEPPVIAKPVASLSALEAEEKQDVEPEVKRKSKANAMPPPPPPANEKAKAASRKAVPVPVPVPVAADTTPERHAQAGPSGVRDETPLRTPSARSAATKATRRLHDEVMPDVVSFQRELKNGSVRAAADVTPQGSRRVSVEGTRKRGSTEEEEGEEEAGRDRKRLKTLDGGVVKKKGRKSVEGGSPVKASSSSTADQSAAAASNVVVMTTQVTLSDDLVKAFTKLGGRFTTKPSECTHLVARSIVRTEKFLCAMAVAECVVGVNWVEMCVAKKSILPADPYTLKDPASESKFGFKLTDALRRAKAKRGKLFAGTTFYVTPKVPVDAKLMKNVITSGGGHFTTQTPTVRILTSHTSSSSKRVVVSSPADIAIWRPLAEAGVPIYSQEVVLTGMLRQEVDWEGEGGRVGESLGLGA